MQKLDYEDIYNSMNGFLCEPDPDIPNEFKAGMPLSDVMERIYEAKLRVLERAPACERELEVISDGYETAMRRLCLRMAEHVKNTLTKQKPENIIEL